ncbi:putative FHY3/FAR1 family protein [Helianthus debilis subsp. tardiflorus]
MEPRKIFQTIRQQDPDRFHVQKDVQNAVAKIRAEQRHGSTPMQSLENVLLNNDFIYETREEPGTEIVTEIFFLHQYSRDMWRALPPCLTDRCDVQDKLIQYSICPDCWYDAFQPFILYRAFRCQ